MEREAKEKPKNIQEDQKGFYKVVNGEIFRPVVFYDEKMVVDNSTLAFRREANRERVYHPLYFAELSNIPYEVLLRGRPKKL